MQLSKGTVVGSDRNGYLVESARDECTFGWGPLAHHRLNGAGPELPVHLPSLKVEVNGEQANM